MSIPGDLVFQSLFETKETPPGSPGSTTSSSTLVNPQSRKVSPTGVKDFAYSDLESKDNHLGLDSAALQDILSSPSPSAETNTVTYETSGPATLWDILASTRGEEEAKNRANAGKDLDISEEEAQEMTCVGEIQSPSVEKDMDVIKASGSATLWGILVSTQDEDKAKNRADAGEETTSDTEAPEMAYVGEISSPIVEKDMDTTETSGPATLWGILASNQGEDEAKNRADGGEKTDISEEETQEMACVVETPSPSAETDMHITEASAPATLWGILASNQGEDEAKNRADAAEETADFSGTEAPGMACVGDIPSPSLETNVNTSQVSGPATLWGILTSTQGEGEWLPQVEKLEIIDAVPKPMKLSTTQKRRAERKRKAERERADRKRIPQKCI